MSSDRLKLCPRVLREVSNIDMSTTVLGEKIEFPICVAPTAMQKMAHYDGEIATAKGCPLLVLKPCDHNNLMTNALVVPLSYLIISLGFLSFTACSKASQFTYALYFFFYHFLY